MKTRPEPPTSKDDNAGPVLRPRNPVLPTVFMRGPELVEQLRNTTAREQINASFSVLQVEITKKTGELREALHTRRFAPVRISPHTIQEAETVLAQADCLLGALPGDPLQAAPEVSKERLCRAVDTALMLDAALRALQSP